MEASVNLAVQVDVTPALIDETMARVTKSRDNDALLLTYMSATVCTITSEPWQSFVQAYFVTSWKETYKDRVSVEAADGLAGRWTP